MANNNRSTMRAASGKQGRHYSVSEVMDLAKRTGTHPVLLRGGKKYRLVTVNPSAIDANNLPAALRKRLTTLNK